MHEGHEMHLKLHPWVTTDGCRTAKGPVTAPYAGGHPMGTQKGSRRVGGVFAGLLNAPPCAGS